MFHSLLERCAEFDHCLVSPYACLSVSVPTTLWVVDVNDGNGSSVVFKTEHTARQFQVYCLSLGISTYCHSGEFKPVIK